MMTDSENDMELASTGYTHNGSKDTTIERNYINMAFIKVETLSKLACCKCNKYLSWYPIYNEPNVGSICGRCSPPENAVRNHLYEQAMEHSKFPCCFDVNGCIDKLGPFEIPLHEEWCKHRTLQCPAMNDSNCTWQGVTKDLYEHYEKKHAVLILVNYSFELDFVHSHLEHCLFTIGQDIYILSRSADSKKNTYSCTVNYIGSNPSCMENYFKLTFKSVGDSKEHVLQRKIGETVEVKGKEMRTILGDPVTIVVNVEIVDRDIDEKMNQDENEFTSSLNYEMLKELECLVCFNYMHPPIFQCQTGHSICSECLPSIKECPTCKSAFSKTQNFALAQIISHIEYPCKYDQCKFVTKAKNIKSHEATCIYSTFECPLKDYVNCEDRISYLNLFNHFVEKHAENIMDNFGISYPFQEDEEFDDSVIFCHGKKLFQMHFAYEDRTLYWYMQLIGPPEECGKYCFEVDIRDNSGGNSRIFFRSKCGPLTTKDGLKDIDTAFLQYDQVQPMINDQLSFEIRVVEY